MRESILPIPPLTAAQEDHRVYVDLSRLVALKYKARDFSLLPRQPVHSLLSGRHASRIRGRGLSFEEIRQYRPGDDVRSIDWKVTARMRSPHTRVFTEERDRPVMLVVDQCASMFFGTKVYMKSVVAAEAAALAAWRVLSAGDRVGALVFNDFQMEEVAPHRSRATVMRILKSVEAVNHRLGADLETPGGESMLDRSLESASRRVSHDYLVVVISDFGGAGERTEQLLSRMAVHNDVLCVMVYDPVATDLPSSTSLRASDGRLQVELRLGSEKSRKSIAEYASGRVAAVLEYESRLGIPVLPLSSAEEAALQVRHLLGARGRK